MSQTSQAINIKSSAKSSKSTSKVSTEQLLKALEQPLPYAPVPAMYKFGLLIVVLTMFLLPLIYLGVIGLIGYGVYWHAITNTGIMESVTNGRAKVFAFVIYAAPIVAGPVVIFFMFKPFFAPQKDHSVPLSVTPQDQPFLFQFINALCDCVGAPRPEQININCEPNASASFRRGLWSFLGNDLALTLGLPLINGLNLRQFSGVLAHEFGHFSQGGAMRLTYLVRSINGWFARVVYERDQWDEKLNDFSRQAPHISVLLVIWSAQIMIWLGRRVLWVLMIAGHLISCFMLRRMEYDADTFETRFAGSDVFEQTAMQLPIIGIASQIAMGDLQRSFAEGKLADNYPLLIQYHAEHLDKKVKKEIQQIVQHKLTGLTDTHPADRDRIRAAQRLKAPGQFPYEIPAKSIFYHYDALCKLASSFTYQQQLGDEYAKVTCVPTEKLVHVRQADESAAKACQHYFQGMFSAFNPVWVSHAYDHKALDIDQATQALKKARQVLIQKGKRGRELVKEIEETDQRRSALFIAKHYSNAGLTIDAKELNLPSKKHEAIVQAESDVQLKQTQLTTKHQPLNDVCGKRLAIALNLLEHCPVIVLDKRKAKLQRAKSLLETLRCLQRNYSTLENLTRHFQAAVILLEQLQGDSENEKLISRIKALLKKLTSNINDLRNNLGNTTYPFDHADGQITIAQYACDIYIADPDDLVKVMEASDKANDLLYSLYHRTMAWLVKIAEDIEKTLRLPTLPEFEEEENQSTPTDQKEKTDQTE